MDYPEKKTLRTRTRIQPTHDTESGNQIWGTLMEESALTTVLSLLLDLPLTNTTFPLATQNPDCIRMFGKISAQPHTLIRHRFCDSNSIHACSLCKRVSMTVMHVWGCTKVFRNVNVPVDSIE